MKLMDLSAWHAREAEGRVSEIVSTSAPGRSGRDVRR